MKVKVSRPSESYYCYVYRWRVKTPLGVIEHMAYTSDCHGLWGVIPHRLLPWEAFARMEKISIPVDRWAEHGEPVAYVSWSGHRPVVFWPICRPQPRLYKK